MIRVIVSRPIEQYFGNATRYVELAGLAADEKPTDNIATGSICQEVDTGKVFFFDEESEEWVEQFSFQG